MHVASSLALIVLSLASPEERWRPVEDSHGIQVWQRSVPKSALVEFRGRGDVKAPLLHIASVLRGIDRYPEWAENCHATQILAWTSATQSINYIRAKMPVFFVEDRDVVLEATMTSAAWGELRLDFKNVLRDSHPARDDAIRMPALHGHWMLTAVSPSVTQVEYQLHADPGGSLPAWLVNWMAKSVPYKTLKKLGQQVSADGYEQHRFVLGRVFEMEDSK